jgi:DnaJ-class molecular chaperone
MAELLRCEDVCPKCLGLKKVKCTSCEGSAHLDDPAEPYGHECCYCNGTGRRDCPKCKGTGLPQEASA